MKHDLNIVGNEYTDNVGNKFIVKEKYIKKDNRNRNTTVFAIEYIDTGGIRKDVRRQEIENGETKDPLSQTVSNVGCIGYIKVKWGTVERNIYETWKNIIYRCYNEKCKAYKFYGAKGVKICERWKRFEYFYKDVKLLSGYDEKCFVNGSHLDLDKDTKGNGLLYSPENCIWMSKYDNRRDSAIRRWQTKGVTTIPQGST